MYIKSFTFLSENNNLTGTVYAPSKESVTPGVLFIHGAGRASRTRYFPWQEYLTTKGFSSFSFDVRGVGDSEGVFEDGSLNNRLIDAQNALQTFIKTGVVDPARLAFGGNSMGAHIVVRLVEKYPSTKAIMLGCAAAYAQEAEDKPLNQQFTEVIRKEGSWKKSPVFSILKAYKGKIFVVYGKEEAVIPQELQKQLVKVAREKGEAYYLPHMGHKLLQPENELQKEEFHHMMQLSGEFLKNLYE